MKFARFSRLLLQISPFGSRNGFHSNFYSTTAMPSRRFTRPWEGPAAELYRRISPIGDWNTSIVPILDQWIEEGRSVDRESLEGLIRELRSYNRFRHALEISMWMTEKRYYYLNSSDAAIRLDLISKVQGIEHVEKSFSNLPEKLKDFKVYGALLKCYAYAERVEKAEAVMQKMREFGFAYNVLAYNVMLSLYSKIGNRKKFKALLQEMEDKGIVPDRFTLTTLLSAYAVSKDIEKMDEILTTLESDPQAFCNWSAYSTAASAYRKAGLLDRALEMLKKSEAFLTTKRKCEDYSFLLTQYAAIGRKDEVIRVWSLYKKKSKVYNNGYTHVLKALLKLGDIEMAEEIFGEWESQDLTYDIQILNIMIHAYSSKGLWRKAETLIGRAMSKGAQPNAWTWYCFATGFLENDQPEKAVEMMKRAIILYEPVWRPSKKYIVACLDYLNGVGDVEEAEEFIKLLRDKSLI